jgi:phosphoribosylaminoimidazolecarboxamide formyltransferase/IMP cyclohydrolase
MRPIRRALISVSDKTGIIEFALTLRQFGVEIISTGGTAKSLREAGVDVLDVSDITGFPEMMDGRVKTLHPRVHGGLLAVRDNPEHVAAMERNGIQPIDMVVVNLYPFAETIARERVTREEAIEQIDIGGPAMIRSAAKNARDVAVVVSPAQYEELAVELQQHNGALSLETRERLALAAFEQTAQYDSIVSSYLGGTGLVLVLNKTADLRYGENPHQQAALYRTAEGGGVANAELLSGKEMSTQTPHGNWFATSMRQPAPSSNTRTRRESDKARQSPSLINEHSRRIPFPHSAASSRSTAPSMPQQRRRSRRYLRKW